MFHSFCILHLKSGDEVGGLHRKYFCDFSHSFWMPPCEADLRLYTITQLVQTLVSIAFELAAVFALRCQTFLRQILRCPFIVNSSASGARAPACELAQLIVVTSVSCTWGFNFTVLVFCQGRNTQARCHGGQIQVCLLGM